jgi:pilus assembly protein Flp/PilA
MPNLTLSALWNDEEGVTALEYALIAALVFVVIVVAVKTLSTKTSNTYNNVNTQMP